MLDLHDKIVLVTGSSQGIGAATAIRFASEGAHVIINYHKNLEDAKKVQEEISKNGGKSEIIQADVSDPAQVNDLFKKILNTYGTIDILINNAGILGPYAAIEEIPGEQIQAIFNTNLFGAIHCAQECIKIIKNQNKTGVILFNSSIHGNHEISTNPFCIPYGATKAALTNFAGNLAKSEAPHIRVNTVAPNQTLTPMWDESEEEKQRIADSMLLKRWTTPEEVADAFVFLAKNEALTGHTLYF